MLSADKCNIKSLIQLVYLSIAYTLISLLFYKLIYILWEYILDCLSGKGMYHKYIISYC